MSGLGHKQKSGGGVWMSALGGEADVIGVKADMPIHLWIADILTTWSEWYTRLATERLIFDEIDRLVDPDAPRKFQRIQRRAEREFGQRFFAPPGGGVERLPDIGAALGS